MPRVSVTESDGRYPQDPAVDKDSQAPDTSSSPKLGTPQPASPSHLSRFQLPAVSALHDYQFQLLLLEQNKKRLLTAHQQRPSRPTQQGRPLTPPPSKNNSPSFGAPLNIGPTVFKNSPQPQLDNYLSPLIPQVSVDSTQQGSEYRAVRKIRARPQPPSVAGIDLASFPKVSQMEVGNFAEGSYPSSSIEMQNSPGKTSERSCADSDDTLAELRGESELENLLAASNVIFSSDDESDAESERGFGLTRNWVMENSPNTSHVRTYNGGSERSTQKRKGNISNNRYSKGAPPRRRNDDQPSDGDTHSNSSDERRKRRRKRGRSPGSVLLNNRLYACPYYKSDPNNPKYERCKLKKFDSIARVKGHILRAHLKPLQCRRCSVFRAGDNGQIARHLESTDCKRAPFEPIDADIVRKAKELARNGSCKTWDQIYMLLFECSEDNVPQAYFDEPAATPSDGVVSSHTLSGHGGAPSLHTYLSQPNFQLFYQQRISQILAEALPGIVTEYEALQLRGQPSVPSPQGGDRMSVAQSGPPSQSEAHTLPSRTTTPPPPPANPSQNVGEALLSDADRSISPNVGPNDRDFELLFEEYDELPDVLDMWKG